MVEAVNVHGIKVVGAFVQPDGRWVAAIGDGRFRSIGFGKSFDSALRESLLNFQNGPTRMAMAAPTEERIEFTVAKRWAFVDATSPQLGPDGIEWVEVFGWSNVESAEIESLDGRVGLPLPAYGAKCVKWRGKFWLRLHEPEAPVSSVEEE